MAPRYLENQIERSRRNLGLETIDVFYLHNPESQLADVSPEVFRDRVKHAFAVLESSVKARKLRYYGMATWNAFRVLAGARDHISLSSAVELAQEVGGSSHHFRFIQLPFNLGMMSVVLPSLRTRVPIFHSKTGRIASILNQRSCKIFAT